MNQMKKIKILYGQSRMLILLSLLMTGLLGNISCNKEKSGPEINYGAGKLLVSVKGIKEGIGGGFLKVSKVGTPGEAFQPEGKVIKGKEFDLTIRSKQTSSFSSSAGFKAAAEPRVSSMVDGMKYRLLLYNKATNTFEQSVELESGVMTEVSISQGQSYDWYAYSYNLSDAIADPSDPVAPKIPTFKDKDLLYSKGTIDPIEGDINLAITFEHKVAMIAVEINSAGMSGDISDIKANIQAAPFINTGDLNLLSGLPENVTPYVPDQLVFSDKTTGNAQVKVANMYTADPSGFSSFTLDITSMTLLYNNNSTEEIITSAQPKSILFDDFTEAATQGVRYIGEVLMTRNLTLKKIAHLSRDMNLGYSAIANMFGTGSSSVFLKDPLNFSSGGHVHVDGFDSKQVTSDNFVDRTVQDFSPDVMILSKLYLMNEANVDALVSYVENGGVLILGTDKDPNFLPEIDGHLSFLRKIFKNPSLNFVDVSEGSVVLPLIYRDDAISNGPFGSIEGLNWGKNAKGDVGNALGLVGLPLDDIVVYSQGNPLNSTGVDAVTVFKHKTLNLFWIGDGGWLANPNTHGVNQNIDDYPFAISTDTHFPILDNNFGHASATLPGGSWSVANSILFGNVMYWALGQSEVSGYNSSN